MAGRPVFAIEAKKNPSLSPIRQATIAMIQENYKLMWYTGYAGYDDVYELYDLENDPEELADLSKYQPEIVIAMGKEIKSRLAEADRPFRPPR